MFDKLFGKASDVVYHTIAPYAVERQRFLEHCREQGFAKTCLEQVAGILLTAAIDLHAHGGLDADQARLKAAATRIERVRSEAGPLAAPASTSDPFFVTRLGGSYSRGITRTRHRVRGRTRPCSTTSPDG